MYEYQNFGCSELFAAANGSAVAYYATSASKGLVHFDIAISPDGELFYELKEGRSFSQTDHLEVTLRDDRNDITYQLVRDGDELTVDGVRYVKQTAPRSIKFVELPEIRTAQYLFMMPDGNLIYVSDDVHHHGINTCRFYMGSWDALYRVHIHEVNFYLDGGTTFIFTIDGVMHAPSPLVDGVKATWTPHHGDPVELIAIPAQDLVINEDLFSRKAEMESDPRSFA